MAAAYDTYDYPSYWEGRDYEHQSELIALNAFLLKIPKIKVVLEIGSGFGRLTPSYIFRAKKVILTDPSARLLKLARSRFSLKKVKFIQSRLETIRKKIRKGSVDLVILIRVLHHIEDIDEAFYQINRMLTKNGFFVLEFANKKHLKAMLSEIFKGNLTFSHDIFPKDLISKRRKKYLPFKNYHPDFIKEKLIENGFKIIEVRSVSNIRSTRAKKILPLEFLLILEEVLQKVLSFFYFGPSIFILAKKVE